MPRGKRNARSGNQPPRSRFTPIFISTYMYALLYHYKERRKKVARLSELVERRKEQLIEELLQRNIYKTSDEKHLYDAPLKILENEYRLVLKKEAGK
ncbi:hypothetical protein BN1002_04732 [Bacillus sp. B-jedd]|nr:hypothetical protein BN1002_04732 [Bacillus sp. B-jedd]